MRHFLGLLFVALTFTAPIANAQQSALEIQSRWIAENFANSRLTNLPTSSTLKVRQVDFDTLGQAHVRMDHYFNDLPVFESEAIVHIDIATGSILSVTDALLNFSPVSIKPALTASQARQRAAAHFRQTVPLGGRDDLAILVKGGVAFLSWKVHAEGDDGHAPIDTIAFIDAQRGGVIRAWNNLHTSSSPGTGKGFFYNGPNASPVTLTTDKTGTNSYYLRDPDRGNQYTCDMGNKQVSSCPVFSDADNLWGDGTLSSRQSIGVDAQYGAAVTRDYFRFQHGRIGIDPASNKVAYNRVHYGRNYNNAFWSDSCFCMTYGDGDGTTFNPFASLDVAGHEMTHGVTSRTANLTYSGESGGLNEATSDIFGTMVEFYANNSQDPGDYYIGEKLFKSGKSAIRSMIQPSVDGASADCWYSGVGSLDVHYSSGVANHFFFLLAEGTTVGVPSKTCLPGNTRVANDTGTLTGIGQEKAAKIWYRALTVYMTSSTNYAGARAATLSAATDLYGAGSTEAVAVAAAWTAVNRP